MEVVTADYLVVGAGAMGMSFVDTLLTESKKTIVIVDRYANPGGHWTTSYPFVRLHQPAAAYGVNSTRLENDGVEEFGWNKGLADCSSRAEVCAYFEKIMKNLFLASGRVQYFPKCEYIKDGQFRSILSGKTYRVGKDTCIVDATYSRTVVPSMRPPPYDVASEVDIVTPNDLVNVSRGYEGYTVVGGGKTSMDACLWLIENGIKASQITWIRPRDSLIFNRVKFQLGNHFPGQIQDSLQVTMESIMGASSLGDIAEYQASKEILLQLDEKVEPTMFHCATVSLPEFEALKKIDSVVRKGHVTSVAREKVVLEHGSYVPIPDTLYIDCSATAITKMKPVTVFRDRNITLQPIRYCQQTFSAALIAHIEANYEDPELKNSLSRPIPMPSEPRDYPLITLQTFLNTIKWLGQPKTADWIANSRLDLFPLPGPDGSEEENAEAPDPVAILEEASQKIQQLIKELPEKERANMEAQLEHFSIKPETP